MDNLEYTETTAKVADSAYSNSCSNSQSRRSHSSKSTHSGSNSSGSSGYGGQPSTSGSSNQPPEKRTKEKDAKKDKHAMQVDSETAPVTTDCQPPDPLPELETSKENDVDQTPTPELSDIEKEPESMDVCTSEILENKDEVVACSHPFGNTAINIVTTRPTALFYSDGFSCVISMHDGVVMYTTASLTTILGFPQDMWIGRSFIDFIHSRDRNTFASQISSGLAIPKIVNVQAPRNPVSTMVCRIRRYRGLANGFGIKNRVVTFMPFQLKLTLKNIVDEEGELLYLVIQATPFFSAFKVPNEIIINTIPFVMRHAPNGNLEYLGIESVPYLGYLPQDVIGQNTIKLYHPDDLGYLRSVYETIVKEGGLRRSKPYRMMSQNGDYIKLETEWSTFINPWSKKLEFVIGKHFILEGPSNPDVFRIPRVENPNITEEERNNQQSLRESIVQIMNEVLTKPAELAKQLMSKRCQKLANFMETLMEDQPKQEEELRLEIQDTDNCYYERDSMLGGISPHHDCNDSKSSTETPVSYNQLNYNENMQRYFDSHQPFSYEDYHTVTGENILGFKDAKPPTTCLSPMAQNSGDSGEMTSSCESGLVRWSSPVASMTDYQRVRLTEALLNKHNVEMEKELVREHRETRPSHKGDRDKTNEKRQKKKEHLARCNALFQPAAVGTNTVAETESKPQGVKRPALPLDSEMEANKVHCTSPLQTRRRQDTTEAPVQQSATITTTVAAAQWQINPVSNMNTFILGVGFPQQMQLMSPVMSQQSTAMPGMIPMFYGPAQATSVPPTTSIAGGQNNSDTTKTKTQFQAPSMQCMMYGQAMYGSPIMYSPISSQVSYPMQRNMQGMMPPNAPYAGTPTLGLTCRNYEEVSEPTATAVEEKPPSKNTSVRNSDEVVDRTDGESSYSSLYSSFFKTESGSAEDNGDLKKSKTQVAPPTGDLTATPGDQSAAGAANASSEPKRRKMEPPWMEKVSVTSELIYKYQILTKSLDEVLKSDKQKMNNLIQPSMVNEQLSQLYLDLQLEGVAARLTLEEGITSSSSSGDDTPKQTTKCEYSKLVMIYEEDAPLPPPSADDDIVPAPEAPST